MTIFRAFYINLILAGMACLSPFAAQAQSPEDLARYQENHWYTPMNDGYSQRFRGEYDQAIASFEEALSLAPTDDHAADAILGMAETYESQMKRTNAVAAYDRILTNYPSSRIVPQVCVRLAALYSSVTLLSPDASQEQKDAIKADMASGKAVEYLKKGIAAPNANTAIDALDSSVLACKLALALSYFDDGRIEESSGLLDELMRIHLSDVHQPAVIRPYFARNSPKALPVLMDQARLAVQGARRGAEEMAINFAIVSTDPRPSIENLQKLAQKYTDADFLQLVAERINKLEIQLTEIQSRVLDSAAENILSTAASVPPNH